MIQQEHSFVPYKDLIHLRNKMHEDWDEKYETTPLNKFKNLQLRIKKVKALLFSFHICFQNAWECIFIFRSALCWFI